MARDPNFEASTEQFPKRETRFSDKNCDGNKNPERLGEPNTVKTALEALRSYIRQRGSFNIAAAFESDATRFEHFSLQFQDLLFDFSKTALDMRTLVLLENLGKAAAIETRRDAMFTGALINETEQRAVLHSALRAEQGTQLHLGGRDIMPDIEAMLGAMANFSNGVRSGQIRGATGKAFTDIVNIGIGGSDLGPRMVVRALTPYHDGPRCHFVSNIDGADIADHLAELDPETTLFIIVSKTFTTVETMSNALIARQWIEQKLGEAAARKHFVAVSTAHNHVLDFGIDKTRIFGFWNWVGGRFSVWSAVGLVVMLAIGVENFCAFLSGARAMDEHFSNMPLRANIPIMHGLIGFFHRVICAYPTRAIIPYEQRLRHLPAFLQQLDMESNGKQTCLDGSLSPLPTAPIVWGAVGTNAQHAFFQLLHQGSDIVPVEFILSAHGHEPHYYAAHRQLIANCLAQAQALMIGKTKQQVEEALIAQGFPEEQAKRLAPHRIFSGNRPTMIFLHDKLTPFALGRLLALYEHRIFVEGVLLNINSFDQWGVELGKVLAAEILPRLIDDVEIKGGGIDGSTRGLIAHLRRRVAASADK